MEHQGSALQLERVPAVLGTDLDEDLRPQFLRDDGAIASRLGAGEVGCYASHLLACRLIVERDLPYAVVLEDDCQPLDGIAHVLQRAIERLPREWDIVKLCNIATRPVLTLADLSPTYRLVRFYRQPPSAGAYLISQIGARKMLAPRRRERPVDMEMRQPWHIGLDMYGVCPPIVHQRLDLISDITQVAARAQSDPRYRAWRSFVYAVEKMGLWPVVLCRVVRWTALVGVRGIGPVWVDRLVQRADREPAPAASTVKGCTS